jgi:hypothetical protein
MGHVFKNWESKTYLWAGMIFFAALTGVLVVIQADKEYVVASFALTGQLVAGLLTYVNSNKPIPVIESVSTNIVEK